MNDRKQHVLNRAHQLFVEKGFQATSIQDILDDSGISKGTFYNYFSSKNELLMAIFRELHINFERERNELLMGNDPADIEVFIKQIELQVYVNRSNNLVSLYDEVLYLNDVELKQFIKEIQFGMLRWVFDRLVDIFGVEKKPFLLDGAILFTAILGQNLRYHALVYGRETSVHDVVRYTVERAVASIEQAAQTNDQLFPFQLIEEWAPSTESRADSFVVMLDAEITKLKKQWQQTDESHKVSELLDFIREEFLQSQNSPRRFLIESALASLQSHLKVKPFAHLQEIITKELSK